MSANSQEIILNLFYDADIVAEREKTIRLGLPSDFAVQYRDTDGQVVEEITARNFFSKWLSSVGAWSLAVMNSDLSYAQDIQSVQDTCHMMECNPTCPYYLADITGPAWNVDNNSLGFTLFAYIFLSIVSLMTMTLALLVLFGYTMVRGVTHLWQELLLAPPTVLANNDRKINLAAENVRYVNTAWYHRILHSLLVGPFLRRKIDQNRMVPVQIESKFDCPPAVFTHDAMTVTFKDPKVSVMQHVTSTVNEAERGKRPHKTILNGISGSVEPGQMTAILGPSGCGKTTLLKTLIGHLTSRRLQQSGAIWYGCQSFHSISQPDLQAMTGYVRQQEYLIPTLTVRETLVHAHLRCYPNIGQSCEGPLAVNHLHRLAAEMGLIDVLDTPVERLSGGEAKRLAVAKELLKQPKVLVLDEPTSALDASSALSLALRLRHIARTRNCIVLVVVHQPRDEIYQLFDRLMIMRDGYIDFTGCRKHTTLYYENVALQAANSVDTDDSGSASALSGTLVSASPSQSSSLELMINRFKRAPADAILDCLQNSQTVPLLRFNSTCHDILNVDALDAAEEMNSGACLQNSLVEGRTSPSLSVPGSIMGQKTSLSWTQQTLETSGRGSEHDTTGRHGTVVLIDLERNSDGSKVTGSGQKGSSTKQTRSVSSETGAISWLCRYSLEQYEMIRVESLAFMFLPLFVSLITGIGLGLIFLGGTLTSLEKAMAFMPSLILMVTTAAACSLIIRQFTNMFRLHLPKYAAESIKGDMTLMRFIAGLIHRESVAIALSVYAGAIPFFLATSSLPHYEAVPTLSIMAAIWLCGMFTFSTMIAIIGGRARPYNWLAAVTVVLILCFACSGGLIPVAAFGPIFSVVILRLNPYAMGMRMTAQMILYPSSIGCDERVMGAFHCWLTTGIFTYSPLGYGTVDLPYDAIYLVALPTLLIIYAAFDVNQRYRTNRVMPVSESTECDSL
eukprot:Clim_evm3s36 gene=Clim_evmTU3s36